MNNFQKQKRVVTKEIKSKIDTNVSMVVAEYQGLNVKEMQQLRKTAKEAGVIIKIYKNRLVKKSLEGSNYEALITDLVGPNLFAFSEKDSIASAKVLGNFAKTHKALKLKAGIYENEVIGAQEVNEIALLPSYDEALTILASSLLGGLKQVAIGLKILVDDNHIKE